MNPKYKFKREPLPNIFRAMPLFNSLREKYPDPDKAIEEISYLILEDREDITDFLMKTGIYVPNTSPVGLDIKKYVETHRDKCSMKELIGDVAWGYCIVDEEAIRLVEYFLGKKLE